MRTSGSTGEPKDVALRAGAVTASAQATLARLGGGGQWVLALPVHYVAGLQVLVRSVLAGTSPVVLAEQPHLAAAAGALTHERRYLAVVPTQLHRMLASPTETAALAGFDAVLLGGAAADADLLDRGARPRRPRRDDVRHERDLRRLCVRRAAARRRRRSRFGPTAGC